MHRLTSLSAASLFASFVGLSGLAAAAGCGGDKKPADDPGSHVTTGSADDADGGDKTAEGDKGGGDKGGGDKGGEKKDECVGFEIANLEDALMKVACEESNVKPDSIAPIDLKGKLEVTVSASPTKPAPGGKVDLLVTYANKSKEPLTLHFKIDPVARFEVEVLDKKGKRADMPAGNPPPPPKGATQPPPSEAKSARLTIAPNGFARARLSWEAVKTKWAPEKYRGTPPERGYPRTPAGPLPKGKYTVKVNTPLVGVSEGIDHEVSAPRVEVEIGG